jgi:hypothetical protein
MVKPDKQDFDAIEKKYGPLPANAQKHKREKQQEQALRHAR